MKAYTEWSVYRLTRLLLVSSFIHQENLKPLPTNLCINNLPLCILQHLQNPIYLQPGKIRNFWITSTERTSYSPCSQVTDVMANSRRSISIRHAMFQNTSKVNPLFSNILSCKVLQNISVQQCFIRFGAKHIIRRPHVICKLILVECHFCWLDSIQSHRYFGGQWSTVESLRLCFCSYVFLLPQKVFKKTSRNEPTCA